MSDNIIRRIWAYQVPNIVGTGMILLSFLVSCGGLQISNQMARGDRRARFLAGAASADIGAFNSALALYQTNCTTKQFPTQLTQLVSDTAAGWAGPYLATINNDPWGNEYIYTGVADNYTLLSIHDAGKPQAQTIRYIKSDGYITMLP